jgi:hypothetical protein
MSYAVAFDQAVPLHHQVYLQVRREIADGLWQGKATKDGQAVSVSVDYKGVVTAQ